MSGGYDPRFLRTGEARMKPVRTKTCARHSGAEQPMNVREHETRHQLEDKKAYYSHKNFDSQVEGEISLTVGELLFGDTDRSKLTGDEHSIIDTIRGRQDGGYGACSATLKLLMYDDDIPGIPPEVKNAFYNPENNFSVFLPTNDATLDFVKHLGRFNIGTSANVTHYHIRHDAPPVFRPSVSELEKIVQNILNSKNKEMEDAYKWKAFSSAIRGTFLNHVVRNKKDLFTEEPTSKHVTLNGERLNYLKTSFEMCMKSMDESQTDELLGSMRNLFGVLAETLEDAKEFDAEMGNTNLVCKRDEDRDDFPLCASSHGIDYDFFNKAPDSLSHKKHAKVLAVYKCKNGTVYVVDRVLAPLLQPVGMLLPLPI